MEASILNSTKKVLGIDSDYDVFDVDILTFINSAFFTLQQLGVGPIGGFTVENDNDRWDDFDVTPNDLKAVKSYIYMRTRLLFDPPATSFGIESIKKQVDELEWRLEVSVNPVDDTHI